MKLQETSSIADLAAVQGPAWISIDEAARRCSVASKLVRKMALEDLNRPEPFFCTRMGTKLIRLDWIRFDSWLTAGGDRDRYEVPASVSLAIAQRRMAA